MTDRELSRGFDDGIPSRIRCPFRGWNAGVKLLSHEVNSLALVME